MAGTEDYMGRYRGHVKADLLRDERFPVMLDVLEYTRTLRRNGVALSDESPYVLASGAAEVLTDAFAEFYAHKDHAMGAGVYVLRVLLESPDLMQAAQGLATMTCEERVRSLRDRRLLADIVAMDCPTAKLRKRKPVKTGNVLSMADYLFSRA